MRGGPHIFSRITYLCLISASTVCLAPMQAQAGHLFTQNVRNTPTWIQAGQGIRIDQSSMEGANGSGNINLDFAANATVPTAADITTDAWWAWSAGDVLKFTVPIAGGTSISTTIAYDTDTSCAYDLCGASQANTSLYASFAAIGSAILALGQGAVSETPLSWTLEALAGQFSLAGYRIYFANGTLNGTGAAALDQSSVIDSGQLGGVPDIDTAHAGYTIEEINSGAVNPVFAGGTLAIDSSGPINKSFVVNDTGGATDGAIDTQSGSIVILNGDITGAGQLTKSGSGALTLTGNNTNTGGFSVQDGTLLLAGGGNIAGDVGVSGGSSFISNGTVGGTTNVNGLGSTLGGAGTFGDVVIGSGASHKPGNSPGDVTVNGTYTLLSGGSLEIEVAADGTSDRLFVNGNVNIGGNLVVAPYGSGFFAPTYSYTVLQNDGIDPIVGGFSSISDNFAFYTPIYVLGGGDGNDFVLTLNRNTTGLQDLAATPNQLAVAGALDALAPAPGSTVATEYASLLGLLTTDQVRTALGSFSAEIYASSSTLLSDRFARSLTARVVNTGVLDQCGGGRNSDDKNACILANSVSFGVTGEYRFDDQDTVPSTEFLLGGFGGKVLLPFELEGGASHAHVGAFASYEQGRVNIDAMASSSDVSSTGLGLLAGWQGHGWDVNGAIGYGRANVEVNRNVLSGSSATAASGSYNMDLLGASLGIGYAIDTGNGYTIKPMGSLTHVRSANSAFSEATGSAFGYNGEAGDYSQTYAKLGLGMSAEFILEDYLVSPRAEVSINQRLAGSSGSLVGSIGGSAPFTTAGIDQGNTTADLSLGVTLANSHGLELNADYGAQLYEGGVAHSANINVKLRF